MAYTYVCLCLNCSLFVRIQWYWSAAYPDGSILTSFSLYKDPNKVTFTSPGDWDLTFSQGCNLTNSSSELLHTSLYRDQERSLSLLNVRMISRFPDKAQTLEQRFSNLDIFIYGYVLHDTVSMWCFPIRIMDQTWLKEIWDLYFFFWKFQKKYTWHIRKSSPLIQLRLPVACTSARIGRGEGDCCLHSEPPSQVASLLILHIEYQQPCFASEKSWNRYKTRRSKFR